jgi:hypothetical protein
MTGRDRCITPADRLAPASQARCPIFRHLFELAAFKPEDEAIGVAVGLARFGHVLTARLDGNQSSSAMIRVALVLIAPSILRRSGRMSSFAAASLPA